jgi:ACS family hexuronate transporter-like MFS transporter
MNPHSHLHLKPAGRVRWGVCALLFAATSINYTDRQVLAVLAPTLQHVIGWDERQYSLIIVAFQVAYGFGLTLTGRLIDRFGTRTGYAMVLAAWSLAAMSHSLASTVLGFAMARFALGLGESGNFPAAIKTVAEWFPRWERSSATGIFNAGSNLGAILAPLAVPWLTVRFGWHAAFLFSGLLSMLWIATWLRYYQIPELQPRLSHQELTYIRSGSEDARATPPPWLELIKRKQTWAYAVAKFLTDPVWWFFLYWLPKFLHQTYGLTLTGLGLPLILIYVASDFGSIGGGWLPGWFARRGMPLYQSRKLAMLCCALAVTPILVASHLANEWAAVAIIGLATAGHQGWSANLYTLASDMFPQSAVGGVTGIGSSAGALGGVLLSLFAGEVLQKTGHYWPLFTYAAVAYLGALTMLHLVVPRLPRAHFASVTGR